MSQKVELPPQSLPFPSVQPRSAKENSPNFLTYLAFEGHGIRIGLELTLSVLLFEFINFAFPWSRLNVPISWAPIFSWFSACLLVLFFDQLVLTRAVHIVRRAYQLGLAGAYESAFAALEEIAPERDSLIKCPKALFHLLRAEILTLAENFRSAELELDLAERAGAKAEQIAIARSKVLRSEHSEDAFEKAQTELNDAGRKLGETAILELEKGLLCLEEHKDLWEAKKTFKKVCSMPEEVHYVGDTTTQLAKASLEATRLWTGEAEEGLDGLNIAIERLRSLASYIDTLRPLLALLHLERSLYLVTHKEPELGCYDLRIGLALCNSPALRKKADKVQEELAYYYQIHLGS